MVTKLLIGVAIGAILGGMLGSTRSCETGGCPLTATPLRGAIYGGFMGLMFALSFGMSAKEKGIVEKRRDNVLIEKEKVMSEKLLILNEENFESTVKEGITLVDFWAPWCGPCMNQLPILEVVADRVSGEEKVAKCNIDENAQLAAKYGIQSIPALLVFKNGEVTEQFVGVQQADTLVDAMAKVAGK